MFSLKVDRGGLTRCFYLIVLIISLVYYAGASISNQEEIVCEVSARIDSGVVCGSIRKAEYDMKYASFRGIPYARALLRELRFKELEPPEPWFRPLNATEEGPICPQDDFFYGRLVKPSPMNEDCMFINVHVPLDVLPKFNKDTEFAYHGELEKKYHGKPGRRVFYFIHGGAFGYGSGNSDLLGPEYLVSKGYIVITANYRLNIPGFFYYNSTELPGNTGLRDQLTALRWVQRNVHAFGGNRYDVTLGGQSAGAVSAHIMALSKEGRGLFKRIIIMSGTAIPTFYSPSPADALMLSNMILKTLGINSTDPGFIHNQLIKTLIEDLQAANKKLIYDYGLGILALGPVIESKHTGVRVVLDDDPIKHIKSGRDKQYPMIIGSENNECAAFKSRLIEVNTLDRIKQNPRLLLAANLVSKTSSDESLNLAKAVIKKYFHGDVNLDDYIPSCKDTLFAYPAFQLARWRGNLNAAPTYVYQFTCESEHSVLKEAWNITYTGNTHVEDLTYIFRENAVLGNEMSLPPMNKDDCMKDWMTMFLVNFSKCNNPSCGRGWPPVNPRWLKYQSVFHPHVYNNTRPTYEERDMIRFYDKLNQIADNSANGGEQD